MKISKLHLVNIKAHADKTFDFNGESTMILGHNGSGKSTIVESIYYALFRELVVPNADYMISNDIKSVNGKGKTVYSAPSYIELELIHNEDRYIIKSALNNKAVSSLKKFNKETGTWGEVANKVTEIYSYIQSNILNGMTAEYFRNSVYTEQMNILNLVSQSEAVRQKEFDKLIGISKFQDIYNGLAKVFTNANRNVDPRINETEKQMNDYISELEKINEFINQEEGQIKTANEEYKKILSECNSIENDYLNAKKNLDDFSVTFNDIKNVMNRLNILKDHENRIINDINDYKTSISDVLQVKDTPQYKDKINSLMQQEEEIIRLSSEMINYVNQKQEQYRNESASIQARIQNAGMIKQNAEEYNACCSSIHDAEEYIARNSSALESGLAKAKKYEDTIAQRKTQKENAITELKLAEAEVCSIMNPYKEYDIIPFKDIESFFNKGIKPKLNAKEFVCPHCGSRVTSSKFLSDLTSDKNKYDALNEKLKSINETLSDLNQRIAKGESLISQVNEQNKNLELSLNMANNTLVRERPRLSKLEQYKDIRIENVDELKEKLTDINRKIAFKLNPVLFNYYNQSIVTVEKHVTKDIIEKIDSMKADQEYINGIEKSYSDYIDFTARMETSLDKIRRDIENAEDYLKNLLKTNNLNNLEESAARYKTLNENVNAVSVKRDNSIKDKFNLEQKLNLSSSAIKSAMENKKPYENFIANAKTKLKANEKAVHDINLLNIAKSYFKQDGLAKTIRKYYIDKINENMENYISLFNFDFIPRIDETAGIENYYMYSGGQKIAIAILMKLILNFILNNPINMLILDEPTPYMDSERIEAIRDLVTSIKDKLQVFVITHDTEFMQIECNRIEL